MKKTSLQNLAKRDLQELMEINKKVKDKNKLCFTRGCTRNAISSHLLQKNGGLSYIGEKGHIYQMTTGFNFYDTMYHFSKRSITNTEALTFEGFCAECDHRIFKPIEIPSANFEKYGNQLLFAYRALLSEYREALNLIECHNLIIQSRILSPEVKAIFSQMRNRGSLVSQIFEYQLEVIEKELSISKRSFLNKLFGKRHYVFYTFKLPKLEIATSTVYAYPFRLKLSKEEIKRTKTISDRKLADVKPIFLTLLPQAECSILIIGFMKGLRNIIDIPVKGFNQQETDTLLKLISDLLVKRLDRWCISLPYYEKLKCYGIDRKIIDIKNQLFIHPLDLDKQEIIDIGIDFDLFKL